MLRAIIFDLDGTLGNTLPVVFAALNAVFRRHLGRTFTDEEITRMFGPNEQGIIQRLVPSDHAAAYAEFLEEYDSAHSSCTAPLPGIPEALAALRDRGVMLGIVTGKGPESADISLRHLGIGGLFDALRAGSVHGDRKPGIILEMLHEWGLRPDQAAYVGDSVSDIESARAAGVTALAAAWAATADTDRLRACNPDELFVSVPELMEWVLGRLGDT